MHGQASIEFMAYVIILLFVLAVAGGIAVKTSADILEERTNADAKRMATRLATEINIAVEIGDGYSKTITLPDTLEGSINYTINTAQQRIFVSWNERNYSLPVIAPSIIGAPLKGTNTIKNINGVIVFA